MQEYKINIKTKEVKLVSGHILASKTKLEDRWKILPYYCYLKSTSLRGIVIYHDAYDGKGW